MLTPWICIECKKQLFDCECDFPAYSNHHAAFFPNTLRQPCKSKSLDMYIPPAWRELTPIGRRLSEEEAARIVWC